MGCWLTFGKAIGFASVRWKNATSVAVLWNTTRYRDGQRSQWGEEVCEMILGVLIKVRHRTNRRRSSIHHHHLFSVTLIWDFWHFCFLFHVLLIVTLRLMWVIDSLYSSLQKKMHHSLSSLTISNSQTAFDPGRLTYGAHKNSWPCDQIENVSYSRTLSATNRRALASTEQEAVQFSRTIVETAGVV